MCDTNIHEKFLCGSVPSKCKIFLTLNYFQTTVYLELRVSQISVWYTYPFWAFPVPLQVKLRGYVYSVGLIWFKYFHQHQPHFTTYIFTIDNFSYYYRPHIATCPSIIYDLAKSPLWLNIDLKNFELCYVVYLRMYN